MDEEDDVTVVFSLALAVFAAVEDEFMTEEGDMVDDKPEVFWLGAVLLTMAEAFVTGEEGSVDDVAAVFWMARRTVGTSMLNAWRGKQNGHAFLSDV